jgi:hypothetical protein
VVLLERRQIARERLAAKGPVMWPRAVTANVIVPAAALGEATAVGGGASMAPDG